MTRKISILGSTGSIGRQTLDVARNLGLEVHGLTVNTNIDLLEEQIKEFNPRLVAVNSEKHAFELARRIRGSKTEVVSGISGICDVASLDSIDIVVNSVVGIAGLIPTLESIKHGKDVALSNKETLVTAGPIVMSEARKHNVRILPVDSEHSAIFQCLMVNNVNRISKILLTASGGPFRGKTRDELRDVTVEQALRHPNWRMGRKITIDCATLMNKGLEVIEARWLFGFEPGQIEVIVHPQSIIHSAVQFIDGAIIAQMGPPDMRIAIQYSLTFPGREADYFPKLDLLEVNRLTFEKPDFETFPCLKYGYDAVKIGGTMPAALNAANEKAVELFLDKRIGFLDIPRLIGDVMCRHAPNGNPDLDDIIEVDMWARNVVEEIVANRVFA